MHRTCYLHVCYGWSPLPVSSVVLLLRWLRLERISLSVLQRRNASRSQREKDNREAESMLTVAGPKGDTEWERALDYVNFGFTRPNGSDLSRMKGLLFSAKSKNVPVKSNS